VTTEATTPRHYTAADIPAGALRSPYGLINEHGLRLIREFEGPPRLKTRLCEGGRWELGPGVTFHLDGSPVLEGETCDEAYAEAMFAHAVQTFVDVVNRNVTVPINSNQKAAYTAFSYNVGPDNFKSSTVLRRINERRYDDAAEAMGAWIYATLGQHKQALRGLARRQYATGCLAMGYAWDVACSDDAIALVRERPPNNVGTDKVLFKTKFTDVLTVAQRYPLPPLDDELILTIPASPPQAAEVAQRQPDPARSPAAGATIAKPSATVSGPAEAAPVKPTVPAPQPVPSARPAPAPAPAKPPVVASPVGTKPPSDNTKMPEHVPYRIDPQAGLKPMEETERFVGAALMLFGTFARVIMANGTALTGVGGVVVVAILDMMKSPTNLAILVTVITMGITAVLWVFAFMIDKLGLKIKKRGEKSATQAMY
jgi:lysozyme